MKVTKEIILTASIAAVVTEALKEIRTGEVKSRVCGICFNLETLVLESGVTGSDNHSYDLLQQLSKGWEHHTGNIAYPVPAGDFLDGQFWKGEQLAYRVSLIDYLLPQVKEGTTYTIEYEDGQ